jgi:hypothetical protein
MTITQDDLFAYAAGVADERVCELIARDLAANPTGETARYLEESQRRAQNALNVHWVGALFEEPAPWLETELLRLAEEADAGKGPGPGDNRALINELHARLAVAGLAPPPTSFFLEAGEALRRLLLERARRQARAPAASGATGGTTVMSETTLATTRQAPEALLAEGERWAGLTDTSLWPIFVLSRFAGRTVAEVASLQNISPQRVEDALLLARAQLQGGPA